MTGGSIGAQVECIDATFPIQYAANDSAVLEDEGIREVGPDKVLDIAVRRHDIRARGNRRRTN